GCSPNWGWSGLPTSSPAPSGGPRAAPPQFLISFPPSTQDFGRPLYLCNWFSGPGHKLVPATSRLERIRRTRLTSIVIGQAPVSVGNLATFWGFSNYVDRELVQSSYPGVITNLNSHGTDWLQVKQPRCYTPCVAAGDNHGL